MAQNLVEQTLTELKKSTLGSYVKAATKDARNHNNHMQVARLSGKTEKVYKHAALLDKRAEGIARAKAKLAKEELEELTSAIVESLADNVELTEEQLQELSRGTLASYTKKAAMSMTKSTSKGDAGTAIKRLKGINASTAKLAKEEIEPLTDEDLAELTASGIDTLTLEEFQDLVLEAVEVFAETFESDEELTEEQLQELSKATLGSYIKKAATNSGDHRSKAKEHLMKAQKARHFTSKYAMDNGDKSLDHSYKAIKREKGISKAVDKLTKEDESLEGDDLQELSKATLGSYTKKAATQGQFRAALWASAVATNRNDPESKRIAVKRGKGINSAVDKLTKEDESLEGDDLQELSKDTLKSYMSKAGKSRSAALKQASRTKSPETHAKNMETYGKRDRGIGKALIKTGKKWAPKSWPVKEELEIGDAIIEALDAIYDLTEEQLDELSKATLKSYVEKAATKRGDTKKVWKRTKKVKAASDSLKEGEELETEELSEEAIEFFGDFMESLAENIELSEEDVEALAEKYALWRPEEHGANHKGVVTKRGSEKAAKARVETRKKSSEFQAKLSDVAKSGESYAVRRRKEKIASAKAALKKEDLDDELLDLIAEEATIIVEALEDIFDLTEEQLQELSKGTLKSYVSKARTSQMDASRASTEHSRKAGNYGQSPDRRQAHHDKVAKSEATWYKRQRGITTAKGKLKEEFDAEVENILEMFLEALDESIELTEEDLVELSKATLGRYVKKAEKSGASHLRKADEREDKAMDTDGSTASGAKRQAGHTAQAKKHFQKFVKREKGVAQARHNLTKEDAALEGDDLQELSKATLGSYATKALQKATTAASQYGDHSASASAAKHDPRGRNDRRSSDHLKGADRAEKKWMKREKGVRTAIAKLAKEDFSIFEGEDLQELSKNKLGDYVRKASLDLSNRSFKDGRKPTGSATDPKALKRVRGITVASLRLQREEEAFELLDIIAESFDLTADEVVEVIESLEEENLQELDSLQELSRDTLISYAKKASSERKTKNQNAAMHTANANTGRDPAWHKVRAKIAKSVARKRGEKVSLAHEKIKAMKEEIENIQELSSETLQRYKKRASEEAKHAKPAKYGAGAHKDNTTHLRTAAWRSENRRGANEAKKIFDKRTKGVAAADAKLKEEVKDIQELSKDTLLSYVKKAHEQNKATKNTAKRLEGSSKAHVHYEKLTGKSHAGAIAKNDAEKAKVERVRPKRLAKVEQARTKIKQLAKEGVELDEGRQPSEYELELRRAKLSRLGERFRKKMAQELKAIEEA